MPKEIYSPFHLQFAEKYPFSELVRTTSSPVERSGNASKNRVLGKYKKTSHTILQQCLRHPCKIADPEVNMLKMPGNHPNSAVSPARLGSAPSTAPGGTSGAGMLVVLCAGDTRVVHTAGGAVPVGTQQCTSALFALSARLFFFFARGDTRFLLVQVPSWAPHVRSVKCREPKLR